jgi:hypothetical protein
LDLVEERFSKGSGLVTLRRQAFALLRYLAENLRRLVTQEEIVRAVWDGAAVSENLVRGCIRELRQLVGDGYPPSCAPRRRTPRPGWSAGRRSSRASRLASPRRSRVSAKSCSSAASRVSGRRRCSRPSSSGRRPRRSSREGVSARGSIKRSDFGLRWNAVLEAGGVAVSDKVGIDLEIQAFTPA